MDSETSEHEDDNVKTNDNQTTSRKRPESLNKHKVTEAQKLFEQFSVHTHDQRSTNSRSERSLSASPRRSKKAKEIDPDYREPIWLLGPSKIQCFC
jgi:hypothetical protein